MLSFWVPLNLILLKQEECELWTVIQEERYNDFQASYFISLNKVVAELFIQNEKRTKEKFRFNFPKKHFKNVSRCEK